MGVLRIKGTEQDLKTRSIVLDWKETESTHIYWLSDTNPNESELAALSDPINSIVIRPDLTAQALKVGFMQEQIAVEPASGLGTTAAAWEEIAAHWVPAVSVPAEQDWNEELAALALAIRHGCRIIRSRDVLGAMRIAMMMEAMLEAEHTT